MHVSQYNEEIKRIQQIEIKEELTMTEKHSLFVNELDHYDAENLARLVTSGIQNGKSSSFADKLYSLNSACRQTS